MTSPTTSDRVNTVVRILGPALVSLFILSRTGGGISSISAWVFGAILLVSITHTLWGKRHKIVGDGTAPVDEERVRERGPRHVDDIMASRNPSIIPPPEAGHRPAPPPPPDPRTRRPR